jgi:hypothetical protein
MKKIAVLALLVAFATGCKKEEEPKAPAGGTPAATPAPKPAETPPQTPYTAKPSGETANDLMKQAEGLFDQASAALQAKDIPGAEAAVKKLEELKAKLPADWQRKVDNLADAVKAAKGAGGLLPK